MEEGNSKSIDPSEVVDRTDFDLGDGVLYTGQLKSLDGVEVPHGTGKQTWPDGKIYDGQWRDGVTHGTGHIHQPNGDQYKGEFVNGQACGYGAYIYANG